MSLTHVATGLIAAIAVLGVITRPGNWAEAWWAVGGALVLVLFALIPPAAALSAVGRGTDVYLFLTGMLLLSELARGEGLFDWLAAYALRHARGSGRRLFLLVYAVGTLVTIFLSNDATAVVLTPAVYAVARQARAEPAPYLLACAFIANAASFVLPISNPANLVVFGDQVPKLAAWIAQFAAASVVSILGTYLLLFLTQRRHLPARIAPPPRSSPLSGSGRVAAAAIVVTGVVLLVASTLGWQLGLPTCIAGVVAWLLIALLKSASPWPVLRHISWGVLPLVAGLFVLVQAIESTGALAALTRALTAFLHQNLLATALAGGGAVALASNAVNNLPMGLIAATVSRTGHLPALLTGAFLIGVDLGPNLSITGSLATILWLAALRREGENFSGAKFLAVGAVVMPLTLLAALAIFGWLSRHG